MGWAGSQAQARLQSVEGQRRQKGGASVGSWRGGWKAAAAALRPPPDASSSLQPCTSHATLTGLQGSQLELPAQQQTRCLAGTQEISTWLCSSSRAILKACSVQRRRRVGSKGESGRPGHHAANAAPSARRLSGHAIAYAHALGRWCNFAHADYVVHGIFQRRVPSNRGSLIG